MDAHKGIANTRQKNIKDPQKKHRLGTLSRIFYWVGLNRFYGANLTLNSDVDQDTLKFGLHETPNLSMHHLPEHINQDITRR